MKKTVSIFLSLLVLFMNSGMALSIHMCQGKIVQSVLSVDDRAAGCAMESDYQDSQQSNCETSLKTKSCCENRTVIYYSGESFDIVNSSEIPDLASYFIPARIISGLLSLFPQLEYSFHKTYSPPELYPDIHLLVQCFLN